MKVLLDTNVLVAAFGARGFCFDIFQVVLAEHQLLVGRTVLQELERTLAEKLVMPAAQVAEVVAFVQEHSEVVAPDKPEQWPPSDPDDRWIVAAALAGEADVLVTGDKDLLGLGAPAALRVETPRGFWEMLRTGEGQA